MIAAATASAILGQAGGGAQRGGQPDRARRREAFDLLLLVELQNRAGAKKADAGRNALDHARHGLALLAGHDPIPAMTKIAQPIDDHHVRAQPGPMALPLALQPERAAQAVPPRRCAQDRPKRSGHSQGIHELRSSR